MTPEKPGILVLCTGNSCRSQITQAYLERWVGDRFGVNSAGSEPAGEIHPLTLEVLAEDGFDFSDRRPQDYRELLGRIPVSFLIIVCDGAAKSCPAVWPGVTDRLLWPFDDPAAFEGSEEEKLRKFREVRDEIRERVRSWLTEMEILPAAEAQA